MNRVIMAMFQTAVKHVAKSSGSVSLHPVPDLNSADHFRTLCLVKRKTSFWFWKKPKMISTQVKLSDLFEEELKIPKPKSTVILEDYTETPTFQVHGNISANKIAQELNLSLSGSDTVTLTIKLGDIIKTEVDWELLQEELEKQRIKMNHPLLREVKKSKRTTLCVVLESLAIKAEGELSEDRDAKVETEDSEDLHKSVIQVDIKEKGDVESKLSHSFKIPPGTVLAYSCNEFSINTVGQSRLHSAVDRSDSSNDPLFLKTTDDEDPGYFNPLMYTVAVVRTEFQPFIKSEKFDALRNDFKRLIKSADNDVLSSLHLLLAAAEFKIDNKTDEKSVSISTVDKLFQEGDNAVFNSILLHLGFTLPENWKDPASVIVYPDTQYDLIKAVISFLDALTDVDKSVRTLLSEISQPNIITILDIVCNEMHSKENKIDKLAGFFKDSPTSQLLLKNAGFVEMKVDDEDVLCFTRSKHFQLLDLYTILYVFSQ